MIIFQFLWIIIPFVTSFLFVKSLLQQSQFRDSLLTLSLSWGVGCGLSSVTYTALHLLGVYSSSTLLSIELISLVLALLFFFLRKGNTPGELIPVSKSSASKIFIVLSIFILIIIILSLYKPHGGWDAWAIWNARSRAMFRMEGDWFRAFTFGQHLDYPILLPASIARVWTILGFETTSVPIIHAVLFLAGLTILLWRGILLQTHCDKLASFSLLVLLAIPFTGRLALMQYSDLPLAFFLLGTIILLNGVQKETQQSISLYVLAGLFVGLTSWTKNEGLSFILIVFVALNISLLVQKNYRKSLKSILTFALAALPILLFVLWFKDAIGGVNDLIEGQSEQSPFTNIFNPARYWIILINTLKKISDIGIWGLIPYLLPVIIWNYRDRLSMKKSLIVNYLTIFFIISIYFLVYSITPHDLEWHVKHSVDRLLYHLTPLLIYTGALMYNGLDKRKEKSTCE